MYSHLILLTASLSSYSQYLISKYSFYQTKQYLKSKIVKSVFIFLTLFLISLIRQFIVFYYICIVILIIYEFIYLSTLTKKLRLLLKQHYEDAMHHEYRSKWVIRYYKRAYREYRLCSRILMIAFLFLTAGFTIYCVHPTVMGIFLSPHSWKSLILNGKEHIPYGTTTINPIAVDVYDNIVCSIFKMFISLGSFYK